MLARNPQRIARKRQGVDQIEPGNMAYANPTLGRIFAIERWPEYETCKSVNHRLIQQLFDPVTFSIMLLNNLDIIILVRRAEPLLDPRNVAWALLAINPNHHGTRGRRQSGATPGEGSWNRFDLFDVLLFTKGEGKQPSPPTRKLSLDNFIRKRPNLRPWAGGSTR